jgi:hypothetical protein
MRGLYGLDPGFEKGETAMGLSESGKGRNGVVVRAILTFLLGCVATGTTLWLAELRPLENQVTDTRIEIQSVKTNTELALKDIRSDIRTIGLALMYNPGSPERAAVLLRLGIPDKTKALEGFRDAEGE